jgi:3-phosphoshikimate 1-carboxyvinyltransferase
VGLTLQCLEDFGIPFEIWDEDRRAEDFRARMRREPGRAHFVVPPAAYKAGTFTVEGDWSGASYFLAAGAVGKRAVCMTNLRADSLQGDRALLDILRLMGADIAEEKERVTVRPSRLRGVDINMGSCPDLVPTVAALAAFAEGRTRIQGTAHLRLKESDRIAAPARNLRAAGITVEEYEDGLGIEGGAPRKAALFHAFGDHRIAMSAALLGLRHGNAVLDDPHVVRKSFPTFWELWERILTGS